MVRRIKISRLLPSIKFNKSSFINGFTSVSWSGILLITFIAAISFVKALQYKQTGLTIGISLCLILPMSLAIWFKIALALSKLK